jgi:hypothetical protein
MRTNFFNFPGELIPQIKKLAAAFQTATALAWNALLKVLARRHRTSRRKPVILKTYGKRGLLPGVDLDDTASLLDLMEYPRDPTGR